GQVSQCHSSRPFRLSMARGAVADWMALSIRDGSPVLSFLASPRARVLVLALTLAALLPGALRLPPIDRDEARFAQATKQMLETKDFIRIRFQDEPRNKKPAGIHWLQAAAVTLASPEARSIWAFRLPSVV